MDQAIRLIECLHARQECIFYKLSDNCEYGIFSPLSYINKRGLIKVILSITVRPDVSVICKCRNYDLFCIVQQNFIAKPADEVRKDSIVLLHKWSPDKCFVFPSDVHK